jgi:alkylation response protein AidB-like acyl-CoA dehydrogenase
MDLSYSPEEIKFRDEVRAFLKENLPAHLSEPIKQGKRLKKEYFDEWHAILHKKGWLSFSWPKEYGGVAWNAVQRYIFDEECCLAGAPRIVPFGINMLAPVLMAFGTEEQKNHYLPRILDGTDWWAQGFSEPGAGSDLASLKTRAVRDGDHYIVNGQKTWTTLGHMANWIFCLVRTSSQGKRQEGISFLLIDMATPGIDIKPIITLDGEHEVNEVFFDDVKVPVGNLVGEENNGWTYAKYLLTHERTSIAGVGFSNDAFDNLKRVAALQTRNGKPLKDDPYFAARMARIEIDLSAMKTTNMRILQAAAAGKAPGLESSLLKVTGTEIRQAINDLNRRAYGPYAVPFIPEALEVGYNEEPVGPEGANVAATQYFNNRKLSIFGGSNEIQKNVIAKMMLGL